VEIRPDEGTEIPPGEQRWFRLTFTPKPGSLRFDS
jgi:hypothetical protein